MISTSSSPGPTANERASEAGQGGKGATWAREHGGTEGSTRGEPTLQHDQDRDTTSPNPFRRPPIPAKQLSHPPLAYDTSIYNDKRKRGGLGRRRKTTMNEHFRSPTNQPCMQPSIVNPVTTYHTTPLLAQTPPPHLSLNTGGERAAKRGQSTSIDLCMHLHSPWRGTRWEEANYDRAHCFFPLRQSPQNLPR